MASKICGSEVSQICIASYTIEHLVLRAKNFANGLKRKFEETIFTNLHFSSICNPCHDRISA